MNVKLGYLIGAIAARGVSATGTLAFTLICARVLDIEEFGVFSLCYTALLIVVIICRWGIEISYVRFASPAWVKKDIAKFTSFSVRTACFLIFTSGFSSFFILTLLYFELMPDGVLQNRELLIWLSYCIMPLTAIFLLSSVFKSTGFSKLGLVHEIGLVALIAAFVIAAFAYFQILINALLIGKVYFFSSVFVFFLSLASLSFSAVTFEKPALLKSETRKQFRLVTLNMGLVTTVTMLATWSSNFYLAKFGTQAEIAAFTTSIRVATVAIILRNVIVYVVNPKLAAVTDSEDKTILKQLTQNACDRSLLICAPPLMFMMVFASSIMGVFGSEYVQFAPILVVLAFAQLVSVIAGMAQQVLALSGYDALLMKLSVAVGITSIPMTGLLTWLYQLQGAAFGVLLYMGILSFLVVILVKRKFGFWPLPLISVFKKFAL